MSSVARTESQPAGGACMSCRRRSWLQSELSGPLDYCARDRRRLLELLALADSELLDALAGRRGAELRARYARFEAEPREEPLQDAESVCRHALEYPVLLDGVAAPRMLEVSGSARRLGELTARPVVAIIGSVRASDYGMEMARTLARGLAASGVTVAAGFGDGIAVAAHAGVLDAPVGASIAVLGGGLSVSCPARRRALYRRVTRSGCVVSELPSLVSGRRWGGIAAERIVVGLASLTVLVEGEQTDGALFGARIAQTLARPLAAIPGRVTSPLSRGPHHLLRKGACLVRGPEDVLELLHPLGASEQSPSTAPDSATSDQALALPSELREILERVGSGCDTPDKLTRAGVETSDALLGLSELEVSGLLARGDGGRYVLRHPFSSDG
jgi:DNA processing protein